MHACIESSCHVTCDSVSVTCVFASLHDSLYTVKTIFAYSCSPATFGRRQQLGWRTRTRTFFGRTRKLEDKDSSLGWLPRLVQPARDVWQLLTLAPLQRCSAIAPCNSALEWLHTKHTPTWWDMSELEPGTWPCLSQRKPAKMTKRFLLWPHPAGVKATQTKAATMMKAIFMSIPLVLYLENAYRIWWRGCWYCDWLDVNRLLGETGRLVAFLYTLVSSFHGASACGPSQHVPTTKSSMVCSQNSFRGNGTGCESGRDLPLWSSSKVHIWVCLYRCTCQLAVVVIQCSSVTNIGWRRRLADKYKVG